MEQYEAQTQFTICAPLHNICQAPTVVSVFRNLCNIDTLTCDLARVPNLTMTSRKPHLLHPLMHQPLKLPAFVTELVVVKEVQHFLKEGLAGRLSLLVAADQVVAVTHSPADTLTWCPV